MKTFNYIATFLIIGILQACNNPRNKDSVSLAKHENREKDGLSNVDTSLYVPGEFVTTEVFNDADFAVEAADEAMLEIQLGKMALTNASDQGIKDFGQLMIDDHSRISKELIALAKQKGIVLPVAPSNKNVKIMNKLDKVTGNDFDRDYVERMVKDHKKIINKFEYAVKNASDSDIRAFANQTLPVLKNHFEKAKVLKDHIRLQNK